MTSRSSTLPARAMRGILRVAAPSFPPRKPYARDANHAHPNTQPFSHSHTLRCRPPRPPIRGWMLGTAIHAPGKPHEPATIERVELPHHVLKFIERGFGMRVMSKDGRVWDLSNEQCHRLLAGSTKLLDPVPPVEVKLEPGEHNRVLDQSDHPMHRARAAGRRLQAVQSDDAVAQAPGRGFASASDPLLHATSAPWPTTANVPRIAPSGRSPEASQHAPTSPTVLRHSRVTRSRAGAAERDKPYNRCIEA